MLTQELLHDIEQAEDICLEDIGVPAELLALQASYAFDPNRWIQDIIGLKSEGGRWDPDPWQIQAADDLINHRFLAMSTGTGPGKTAFCAMMILFFLSTRPFPRVLCTAPTQPQLRRALWPEVSKWMRHSDVLNDTFEWTQTRISMKGQHSKEWFAEAKTAKPASAGEFSTESLQGLHEENILLICDEASGIPDQVMNAIDGCVTTEGAYVILAGNPLRRRGYFFRVITDERKWVENGGIWKVHFVNSLKSKHVDTGMVDRNIKLYGINSDYYRVKVLGLPPLADAHGIVSPEQIYDMHIRRTTTDGVTAMSCDPARYGGDDSVFYVRKGWTIVDRVDIHGMDTQKVADIGMDLFKKYNPDFYMIDEIGIGSGVVDRTKVLLEKIEKSSALVPVSVGEEAFTEGKFMNLRSELFFSLRNYVDRISILFDTDRLDEELQVIKYGWNKKDTRIQVISKDEIKKEIQRSPNDADAFVLLFYKDMEQDALSGATADPEFFRVGSQSRFRSYRTQNAQEDEYRDEDANVGVIGIGDESLVAPSAFASSSLIGAKVAEAYEGEGKEEGEESGDGKIIFFPGMSTRRRSDPRVGRGRFNVFRKSFSS